MEVASKHLAPYLNTIHTFLNNDAKTLPFPNLTVSMEDLLARIVDDNDFLKQGVDGECKSVAAKITAALERNKSLLTYKFECDVNGKRVMVFKKTPVAKIPAGFKEPEAMKPLRKPNCYSVQAPSNDVSAKTVMSTFKIFCLNATLKFVKNEKQTLLQYPGLTTEQRDLIKHMIAQCLNPTAHSGTGFKNLYDPLTEALKIFSFKYEFELTECTPENSDVKKLTFVKKLKPNRNIESKDLNIPTEKVKKLKQVQPLIQTMSKIDAIFIKDAILKIQDFISNRESDSINFSNVSAREMMFLCHWNTVVNRLEIIRMLDLDVRMALDVIRDALKRATGTYKLEVTSEVTEVRNVKFTKVYTQKSLRLPKSSQSQPNLHSTQVIEPHSHFTLNNKANSHSTHDMNKHLSSTQVIKANSHSTQDDKAHSQCTQVIEVPGSDEEFDDLRNTSTSSSCSSESRKKKTQQKIEQFVIKAKSVPVHWIRTHLTRIKEFIDSDKKTLVIDDRSEYYFFLRKSMTWLSLSEVLSEFTNEVQELLKSVQQAVLLNAPKFSLKVGYTQKNKGCKKLVLSKTLCDNEVSIKSSTETAGKLHSKSSKTPDVPIITRVLYDKQKLPVAWIRTTLLRVKAFIETESEASLVVPDINPLERAFVSKYLTWLYRRDCVESFSDDLKGLVGDLQRVASVKDFSVQGLVVKKKEKSKTSSMYIRDFLFTKVPRYTSLGPLATQIEPNNKENRAQNQQSNVVGPEIVPKQVPDKIELKSSLNKGDNVATKDVISQSESNPFKKSSSVTALDKYVTKSRKSAIITTNLPPAKAKLIEALNQPLVSEKGLRMMRLMGWEGGALGARGDGIMEPIALSLDLARRAGLGAMKIPSKQSTVPVATNLPVNIIRVVLPHYPSKAEFVVGVVGILHRMTSTQMATELVLTSPMSQRKWSFVRQLILQLNHRSQVSLEKSLTYLVAQINEYLMESDFIFNAIMGVSCKNILFILSKGIYQSSDLDPKDWCSVVNIEINLKKIKIQTNSQEVAQTDTQDAVMVAGDAFRYYVLAVILDFCQVSLDKPIVKEIMLKGCMTLKQRNYIKDTVHRINAGSRASTDSENERTLFEEIVGAVTGFRLDVDFPLFTPDENKPPVYKCIRLHKVLLTETPSTQKKSAGKTAKLGVNCKQTIQIFLSTNESADSNKIQTKIDKTIEIIDKNAQSIVKNFKTNDIFKVDDQNIQVTKVNTNTKKPSANPTAQVTTENTNTKKPSANPTAQVTSENTNTKKPSANPTAQVTTENTNTKKPSANPTAQVTTENTNTKKPSANPTAQVTSENTNTKKPSANPTAQVTSENTNTKKPSANPTAQVTTENTNTKTPSANPTALTNKDIPHGDKNQNSTQNEPTDIQSDNAMGGQNEQMDFIDESAGCQNEPRARQIISNDTMADCFCCLPDNGNSNNGITMDETIRHNQDNIYKDLSDDKIKSYVSKKIYDSNNNAKDEKKVEYIFIENVTFRTVSSTDEKTPIASVKEPHQQNYTKTGQETANDVETLRISTDAAMPVVEESDALIDFVNLTLNGEGINKDNDVLLHATIDSINLTEDKSVERRREEDNIIKDLELKKRLRPNAQTPDRVYKKRRIAVFEKQIIIRHKDHPQVEITPKMAGDIQKSILENIVYTEVLPLLKCNGIQDGGLVYSCHSQKSLDLMGTVAKSLNFKIESVKTTEVRHKMVFKINTYLTEQLEQIFNRLETFNLNLDTKEWLVTKKEQTNEFIIVYVDIDEASYKLIQDHNFILYAGIDAARFSIVLK